MKNQILYNIIWYDITCIGTKSIKFHYYNANGKFLLRLADYKYSDTPLIIESLCFLIHTEGYFFKNQEAICYVNGSSNIHDSSSNFPRIILTKNYLYAKGKVNNKYKYCSFAYKDITSFEYYSDYKYDSKFSGPVFLLNNVCYISLEVSNSVAVLVYKWILFVILSLKYTNNETKRAVNLNDYDNIFKEELKESKKDTDSSCFITTATCLALGKGDNCYELNMFRSYRDEWLIKQIGGIDIVNEYYHIVPNIVKNIDKNKNRIFIYKKIWEKYLRLCLSAIEKGNYEQCKSIYVNMVNFLNNLFVNKS